MATKVGFQLESSLASKHLTDAQFIKGSYAVVSTIEERDNLYVASDVSDGTIVKGSLCFCQSNSKFYQHDGSTWVEKKLVPVFIGTTAEYEAQKDTIPEGAIVIITDDNDSAADSTSSILGTGVLGYMILG